MFCARVGLCFFLVCNICTVSLAATPFPPKLLSDTPVTADAPVKSDPLVERSRPANVDFNLLGGEGRSSDKADQDTGPSRITLNLFPDVQLVIVRDKVENLTNGGYSWEGKVDGDDLSQVIFVVHDGRVTGDIRMRDGVYQVRAIDNGGHAIYQINEQKFPDDKNDTIPADGQGYNASPLATDKDTAADDDGSTIDVLVAYTPNAARNAGGARAIEDLIAATIVGANNAYRNSNINQRLNLVRTYQTTINSSGSFDTDLDRLTATDDGFMDEIHGMRDNVSADVVSLWVETSNSCGIAHISSTASTAFSVVAQSCANGNLSFVHELGHNMGARHDWFVDKTVDNPTYNHGHVNTTGRWRTVMAYNDQCSAQNINCTRVAFISNPLVNNTGSPTGISGGTCTGQPGCDADNARVHNDRAVAVANFRQSGGANPQPPAAPSNLSTNPESATQITLNWNDNSDNETEFKIESCVGVDCTNFVQIATVGANVTNYTENQLDADTTYVYRIRATNNAGDSDYSNIAFATTLNIVEE